MTNMLREGQIACSMHWLQFVQTNPSGASDHYSRRIRADSTVHSAISFPSLPLWSPAFNSRNAVGVCLDQRYETHVKSSQKKLIRYNTHLSIIFCSSYCESSVCHGSAASSFSAASASFCFRAASWASFFFRSCICRFTTLFIKSKVSLSKASTCLA
jgi:hypothetical protein